MKVTGSGTTVEQLVDFFRICATVTGRTSRENFNLSENGHGAGLNCRASLINSAGDINGGNGQGDVHAPYSYVIWDLCLARFYIAL